jgi:hypothetical protein
VSASRLRAEFDRHAALVSAIEERAESVRLEVEGLDVPDVPEGSDVPDLLRYEGPEWTLEDWLYVAEMFDRALGRPPRA